MGARGGIGVPIELPITSARLTSPFIVDVWVAAISGRIDRLVLDPTQIAASDWAPLLWLSKTYHVPVERRVEDSSPTVACAMAEATDIVWHGALTGGRLSTVALCCRLVLVYHGFSGR